MINNRGDVAMVSYTTLTDVTNPAIDRHLKTGHRS